MTERVIDISDEPVALSVRNELLVIQPKDQPEVTIPFGDLAAVVISQPAVTMTHAVLSSLASKGGSLVVCDGKHVPAGMLLPLEGHHVQAERFVLQARCPLPVRKRLWQQVIRAKIKAQAGLLASLRGDDHGLQSMVSTVRSGDPANVEAQAAKRYWGALFGPDFRRDHGAEDQNRHLNYGYAILRAVTCRAICAAGLHPSISIHHHNRYDAFCLASDLTEPFRPLVDKAVCDWVAAHDARLQLDKSAKNHLLTAMTRRYDLGSETRTLFDILSHLASSLAAVFEGLNKKLAIPEL